MCIRIFPRSAAFFQRAVISQHLFAKKIIILFISKSNIKVRRNKNQLITLSRTRSQQINPNRTWLATICSDNWSEFLYRYSQATNMDHDDSDIVVLKVLFFVESDSFSFEFSDYLQVGTTVVRSSLVLLLLLWLLLFVHTYFFKVRASLTASIPSCVKHETWISARHFTAWGMSLWVMLFNRTFFVFSAVVFFSKRRDISISFCNKNYHSFLKFLFL